MTESTVRSADVISFEERYRRNNVPREAAVARVVVKWLSPGSAQVIKTQSGGYRIAMGSFMGGCARFVTKDAAARFVRRHKSLAESLELLEGPEWDSLRSYISDRYP